MSHKSSHVTFGLLLTFEIPAFSWATVTQSWLPCRYPVGEGKAPHRNSPCAVGIY